MKQHKAKYWHWTLSSENLQILTPSELFIFKTLVHLQPASPPLHQVLGAKEEQIGRTPHSAWRVRRINYQGGF